MMTLTGVGGVQGVAGVLMLTGGRECSRLSCSVDADRWKGVFKVEL